MSLVRKTLIAYNVNLLFFSDKLQCYKRFILYQTLVAYTSFTWSLSRGSLRTQFSLLAQNNCHWTQYEIYSLKIATATALPLPLCRDRAEESLL